jgi:hypothetical protein
MLDEIFIAQFLHRSCPDARLLFFGADLLMVREIDDLPFIGSLTITPYPLIGLRAAGRAHPDSTSEAFYNAVSYTFWRSHLLGFPDKPPLQGYRGLLDPNNVQRPSLWATTIGKDGYYPLAVLSASASDDSHILPTITTAVDSRAAQRAGFALTPSIIYPARSWAVLWALVSLLCLTHTVMLLVADYWSPFTRDLAIRDNDLPRRRSMYIHVATAMLFAMTFVVSFPVMGLIHVVRVSPISKGASLVALGFGIFAVISSFWKTRGYIGWVREPAGERSATEVLRVYDRVRSNAYLFLNLGAWAALAGVPGLWCYLCCTGSSLPSPMTGGLDFQGLCFSYRCIHPGSGVSPLVPVLLLLFSWYLWAVFQTLRLRFSANGRPRLPKQLGDGARLFVSDDDLDQCRSSRDSCLYRNITSLLITREVIHRCFECRPMEENCRDDYDGGRLEGRRSLSIDVVLGTVYVSGLIWFSLFTPIRSLAVRG